MIKNSQSTLQMPVNHTNQLSNSKRLLEKQNSQIIQRVKVIGERQDISTCTVQLEQTIKPISFRQTSQIKFEGSKLASAQSQNSTPKNHIKGEGRNSQQVGLRQYSLDQPKITFIDLRSQAMVQKNDSYFNKESQRKLQQNPSNNLFRLRQNSNWFCQKPSIGQPKTEKITGKKDFSKKIQETQTPTSRGACFDKSNFNNANLEFLAKQKSEESQQNPQNFGQLCSQTIFFNKNDNQINNQKLINNKNNNIFSQINSSKQNYFQIAQKKNENLQNKLNQNQQQENFQQRLAAATKKQNQVNKVNNVYSYEQNNLKNKNEELKKIIINQYQQQLLNQQQKQSIPNSKQNISNKQIQSQYFLNKTSLKTLKTSHSQSELELPAEHLQKDKDEGKKIQLNSNTNINEQQNNNNFYQKINSMTDHTVTQSVQRQKYFEIRNQSKELPKYQKQAKTLDQQQLLNVTNIIEADEPIQSSGKFNYISPIIKNKQRNSPKGRQTHSSQQSYDQIKIWQSSEKCSKNSNDQSIIRNLEPIIRPKINAEVQKREDFIKLYTKRYKNYPQLSPNQEKMSDQEIQNLVLDVFFNSNKNQSPPCTQTSIQLESKQYNYVNASKVDQHKLNDQEDKQTPINILSTDSGNANMSTLKNNKQMTIKEKYMDVNIPYQVAMMQINSYNSCNSVKGYLSKESTQIKKKINNIFFSDTKDHKQFIKSFFQETNNMI